MLRPFSLRPTLYALSTAASFVSNKSPGVGVGVHTCLRNNVTVRHLIERVKESLVGTECALDCLCTAVAAEFPRHVHRLVRQYLEDLQDEKIGGAHNIKCFRTLLRPACR